MEVEAKNGMHSKRLPDSHLIKKLSMKDQDNLGLEAKTKEILRQLIILTIEDQKDNHSLLLMQKLNGGLMVMELEVKNGMLLMKSVDSLKIKKNSMKELDNHGFQVKIKKIKNQLITYST